MHGVVVIPPSAPDEAVALEDVHQFVGEAVGIDDAVGLLLARVLPEPVVAHVHTDVDGHAVGVGTLAVGTTHLAPVEGAARLEVLLELGKVGLCGNVGSHGTEAVGGAVHVGEEHLLAKPRHLDEVGAHLRLGVAVHLLEEGFATAASRILQVLGFLVAPVVGEGEHVLGVGIVEFLLERFLPSVVIDHLCAVGHDELPVSIAADEVGIGGHEATCPVGDVAVGGTPLPHSTCRHAVCVVLVGLRTTCIALDVDAATQNQCCKDVLLHITANYIVLYLLPTLLNPVNPVNLRRSVVVNYTAKALDLRDLQDWGNYPFLHNSFIF